MLVFLASTLYGTSPFAGQWALQSDKRSGSRVFWLKIDKALPISGSFFGATGGRLAKISHAQVIAGELRFIVERTFEGNVPRVTRALTRARLSGDGLVGSTEIDGTVHHWTGWRSPEIRDRDDGSWQEGQQVDLLRSGLPAFRSDRIKDWRLNQGILQNLTPKADLLVTRDNFWNFKLHAEYKLPPQGNSGIGLRHH
jgi:hypothetical protein